MKDKKDGVSIVIPVYNSEKYIARCIDSLLQQKNIEREEMEILLINDGSTDDSEKICLEYQEKHPEVITLFSQKNAGVGAARNKGVQRANYTYTMFVDNDDYVDEDYCFTFLKEIRETKNTVVIGGWRRENVDGKIILHRKIKNHSFSKYLNLTMWGKIFETNYLLIHSLEEYATKIGEDIVASVAIYAGTEKVSFIDYDGYCWFFNQESVSETQQSKLDKKNQELLILLFEKIHKYASNEQKNDKEFQYFIIRTLIYSLLHGGKNATSAEFLQTYKGCIEKIHSLFPTANHFVTLRESTKDVFSAAMSIIVFQVLAKLHLLKIFTFVYCSKPKL